MYTVLSALVLLASPAADPQASATAATQDNAIRPFRINIPDPAGRKTPSTS